MTYTMNNIEELARDLPKHQTNRGNEFREIPVNERKQMARMLIIARSQATSNEANWDDQPFRREMLRKKERYFHNAGELGITLEQAYKIWWSVVHGDPAPIDKRVENLI